MCPSPMSKRFSVGDLVWAKAEGFPFWPGRIASKTVEDELKTFKNHEGKAVLFFGQELTYSLVEEKYIKAFAKSTDMKYTGPADLKEEFEVAVRMALENKEFEEPPLELDEEERLLKQVKYDVMREASDANTSVEESIPEDKKQNVSNEEKPTEEGGIDEPSADRKMLDAEDVSCERIVVKKKKETIRCTEMESLVVEKKNGGSLCAESEPPADEKREETGNTENSGAPTDGKKSEAENAENSGAPEVSMNPVESVKETAARDKKQFEAIQ